LQRKLEKLYRDVQLGNRFPRSEWFAHSMIEIRQVRAARAACSRETLFACKAITRPRRVEIEVMETSPSGAGWFKDNRVFHQGQDVTKEDAV